MSNSHPLPPKKEVALALLERSNDRGIFVHLDPRHATVIVPPWFKKQPQLVLQIGLNMPVPIPDLRLDDQGMSCTLSFNRSPFYCVVPWSSVFAMVGEDGRGMVWPDDVPAEVPLSRQGQQASPAAQPQASPVRAVEGAKKDSKADKDGRADAAKAKRPRKRTPLVAVPDGEGVAAKKGRSPRAPLSPVKNGADGAQASRQAAAPAAAQKRAPSRGAPVATASKGGKKRELPPYLRVVK
jgi:stringent starvation protein B